MSLVASKKMFNWFVRQSSMPQLFKNDVIRDAVWQMCKSQFCEIFEEGLVIEADEELTQLSNKFYRIVDGLIWNQSNRSRDDLCVNFEMYLDEIKN